MEKLIQNKFLNKKIISLNKITYTLFILSTRKIYNHFLKNCNSSEFNCIINHICVLDKKLQNNHVCMSIKEAIENGHEYCVKILFEKEKPNDKNFNFYYLLAKSKDKNKILKFLKTQMNGEFCFNFKPIVDKNLLLEIKRLFSNEVKLLTNEETVKNLCLDMRSPHNRFNEIKNLCSKKKY
jgi:hypothetical protein